MTVTQRPHALPAPPGGGVVFLPPTFFIVATDIASALSTIACRDRALPAWRLDCATAMQTLLAGDASAIVLQCAGDTVIEGSGASRAVDGLHASYLPADGLLTSRVWSRISRARRITHDPAYAVDTIGVTVALPARGALTVMVLFDRLLTSEVADAKRSLLEIVQPVLVSAAEGRYPALERSMHSLPDAFTQLLSTLSDGVVVCDERGTMLSGNAPLDALLTGDPESSRVLDAAALMAREIGARRARARGKVTSASSPASAPDTETTKVLTPRFCYRLRAASVPEYSVVLVTVGREGKAEASVTVNVAVLGERYRLTRRELEVAALLVRGRGNQEIAAELNMSIHTARHHTERVMEKLGVHSRAGVAVAVHSS